MSELTLQLPKEYVNALSRRHNGAKHTKEEIEKAHEHLKELYAGYLKAVKSLNKLWVYWDKANIEAYFKQPKWYNAHSRRRKYEKDKHTFHKYMFSFLTYFDGNGGESFDPFYCISAEDIMYDFEQKYLKEYKK